MSANSRCEMALLHWTHTLLHVRNRGEDTHTCRHGGHRMPELSTYPQNVRFILLQATFIITRFQSYIAGAEDDSVT